MKLKNEIFKLAKNMEKKVILRRRDLHMYPEPGWTEFRTASIVAKTLVELGYNVQTGDEIMKNSDMMGLPSKEKLEFEMQRAIKQGADETWVKKMAGGKTGVVATMDFSEDGPTVAIRFDMDSNDLIETSDQNHLPNIEGFSSKNAKAMHGCGHDGHTSMGLAIAEILATLKDQLKGKLKLIFQPAEEGVRGARAMVASGIVDDVDFMLGAHIGFKLKNTGDFLANLYGFLATSKYDVSYKGLAAHAGANPENGKNALLAAANATLNLNAIARHSGGASRINVGVLNAGSGRNVIADHALIKLETRGETTEINEYMEAEMKRIVKASALMYDVEMKLEKVGGALGGNNSPNLIPFIEEKAKDTGMFNNILGSTNFGGSEDFSYFMERVQKNGGEAAYMLIGASLAAGHHDSHFDFDETALLKGVVVGANVISALLLGEYK